MDGQREIRLNLAVGGGLDAESFTMRPKSRCNLPRGAICGYHQAQFEESSGKCRLIHRLVQRLGIGRGENE